MILISARRVSVRRLSSLALGRGSTLSLVTSMRTQYSRKSSGMDWLIMEVHLIHQIVFSVLLKIFLLEKIKIKIIYYLA